MSSPATLFGEAVSISNEFAVISRPFDDAAATSAGSAYLYNVESGELITKLLASDAADAIAYGVPFIANPDLPTRFRTRATLNVPD